MKRFSTGRNLFAVFYISLVVLLIFTFSKYTSMKAEMSAEENHRLRERGIQSIPLVEEKQLPPSLIGSDYRLSTANQQKIYDYCNSIGVDPYMILAMSLTLSNGDMRDLFNSGADRNKEVHYVTQISIFLKKLKIVSNSNHILFEDQKVRIQKPYLKAFVDTYGKQKLTRLYNNYYIVANKNIE